MAYRAQRVARLAPALAFGSAAILTACGGGTTEYGRSAIETDAAASVAPGAGAAPGVDGETVPVGVDGNPLLRLEDDPGLLTSIPEIVLTEILADSGLQVAYTDERQRSTIEPGYVEAQWQHMQSCTGVTAPPPLVVVLAGAVAPFVATDDVIRAIDGRSVASSSETSAGTVVQISAEDFDGSLGSRGFTLRAILGRMLWLGASLAERDYPFACARTDPSDVAG